MFSCLIKNCFRKTAWIAFIIAPLSALMAQEKPAEQYYSANAPGVVMVQTVFAATVYVNKVVINERRFQLLVDSVKKLDTTGTMFSSEEKLDIVVKALYNRPTRYFNVGNGYYQQKHRVLSAGTGFFITGDGHVLTNCHIIDRDSQFIVNKFFQSTYEDVTNDNIRALQNSWGMTLNDEQRNLLSTAYTAIYRQVSTLKLFDVTREIYVRYRIDNGTDEFVTQRMPATVVVKGRPMPGRDVAILKVDSVSQLPTLPVTKDSVVKIGEQVFVYGYPEPVNSNAFLARETAIEPTLTAGIVSAIKKSINGWPVVQMDAAITHGSSGSPVCNSKGEVIALATFGSLEQSTGSLATGFNFAIPVSVVRAFLDSVKLIPQMSRATLLYNEGLEFFSTGYYDKAQKQFVKVKKLNPTYPQLSYYINESGRRTSAGLDRESFLQKSFFRVIALVLIIGGIVIYYGWQRIKGQTREERR